MPRYAPTEHMVEAVFYDGTVDTAVAAAKLAGENATLVFPEGRPILRIHKTEVQADVWVIRNQSGGIAWVEPDSFGRSFFLIDRPAPEVQLPIAPTVVADKSEPPRPRQSGEFREGDSIKDRSETDPRKLDDVLEVLEVSADGLVLRCDGPWGERTIPTADAVLVQAAS